MKSLELFTGAGGLAQGIAAAGFRHAGLVEWNADACDSLRENVGRIPVMASWPIYQADVRAFDFGTVAGDIALLGAGAPCQPFSIAGKHRGNRDERNMFPEVFRAMRELRPQAVVVENVKGLLRKSFRPYFDYILLQLSAPEVGPLPGEEWRAHKARIEAELSASSQMLRYRVRYQLLNAADYGVPQKRERVFMVGFRSDVGQEWVDVEPTHTQDAMLYAQWVDGSYWESLGVARPPALPDRLKRRVERLDLLATSRPRWRTVRDALCGLPEPVMGKEHPTILNHVGNPGAKQYPGHTGSPMDLPAKTLKAGDHGVPGGENMLRRLDGTVRYFTVREAARLQGFPDDYLFRGSWSEIMRQLGNAVPVPLAQVVATRLRDLLSEAKKREPERVA